MTPFEMAKIYWSWLQGRSVQEVASRMDQLTPRGKKYWTDVLNILENRKAARKQILQ